MSNYDRGHKMYGMFKWKHLFSPRQLLCHGTSVEVFREMLDADRRTELSEVRKAAYGYLALTLDTMLNYNNRAGRAKLLIDCAAVNRRAAPGRSIGRTSDPP